MLCFVIELDQQIKQKIFFSEKICSLCQKIRNGPTEDVKLTYEKQFSWKFEFENQRVKFNFGLKLIDNECKWYRMK